MSLTTISVVVPTYRRPQNLRSCIDALLGVDYPREALELVVVDDAADPATAELLRRYRASGLGIKDLKQQQRGAAAARNAGARAAEGELLLFCDDDFIVMPDHLRLHVETHRQLGDVLVGGLWEYAPTALATLRSTPFGRFRLNLEAGFRAQRREVRIWDNCFVASTLAACDLSVSRETFWELEGFDERFPFAATEDQDLSLRAVAAGYQLIRNKSIIPLHEESWVTLRQFCEREERGAETLVVLVQKHPEALGEFVRHEWIQKTDSPALMMTKLVKSALSTRPSLRALHDVMSAFEHVHTSDVVLAWAYHRLIGLHLFRGFRRGLEKQQAAASDVMSAHV